MKSLLLVAHVGRRAESNAEIGRLAARLCERLDDPDTLDEHAFLELAEPSIPDAIERCGATKVAVPLGQAGNARAVPA